MTTSLPLLAAQLTSSTDLVAARLQRNYEFLTYGLIAAWAVLAIYVLVMLARQKQLKQEIANLRALLENHRT
jgi:CcmD family protein